MLRAETKKKKILAMVFITLLAISAVIFSYYINIQTEQKLDQLRSKEKELIKGVALLKAEISKVKEENAAKKLSEESDDKDENTDTVEEDGELKESGNDNESPTPQPAPQPEPTPQPSNWWSYPANITTIPLEQVTHKSVVNKGQKLPSTYAPSDLVVLTAVPGIRVTKNLYVRSIIIEPLRQLGAAAQSNGIDLSVISAYRSYQTQESTYQYWVNYNGGSVDAADQVSARPGHSEHQLGTVVDFSTNEIGDAIGSQFHSTKAAAWLAQNAPKYGFKLSYPVGEEGTTGYAYESWHWRYWGGE